MTNVGTVESRCGGALTWIIVGAGPDSEWAGNEFRDLHNIYGRRLHGKQKSIHFRGAALKKMFSDYHHHDDFLSSRIHIHVLRWLIVIPSRRWVREWKPSRHPIQPKEKLFIDFAVGWGGENVGALIIRVMSGSMRASYMEKHRVVAEQRDASIERESRSHKKNVTFSGWGIARLIKRITMPDRFIRGPSVFTALELGFGLRVDMSIMGGFCGVTEVRNQCTEC